VAVAAIVPTIAALGWAFFVATPKRPAHTVRTVPSGAAAPLPAPMGRKIKAHLFYVADGGQRLTSVEQDVPFGEGTVEQAKAIVTAQLTPVADPLVSAIPAGTALRALFVTPDGDAYADFSSELIAAHPGGSMNEQLTVHTIVQVLTENLPGIRAVQILVDGKEVDTLAGHLDLRRPLAREPGWVE
jgi:spore germination protein GerM